jgi:hypothetical protein
MVYALYPLLVVTLWLSILAQEQQNTRLVQPSALVQQANVDADTFLSYRDAVSAYMQSNPQFLGAIPAADLPASFTPAFLATAGNAVSVSPSGNGRIITCYAAVSGGAIAAAVAHTEGDVSIGESTGSSWVSAAPGALAVPEPLPLAITAGDIVSVIQTGV